MANKDAPIMTTDWADVQYKFGNKVGAYADPVLERKILKQKIAKIVEDAVDAYDPNEHKTLAEIDEELEESYDDDRELERLRQQRLAELQKQQTQPTFGRVRRIDRSDYVMQVTNAGKGLWGVLLLGQPDHKDCERLKAAMDSVAAKYTSVKFLEIIATECIPGFPDSQLPCVIIYRSGNLEKQCTGLDPWGGKKFTAEDVAYELHKVGVIVDEALEE
eukprot:NODE_1746_length_898_cov_279.548881_g1218_i0.p1 GENE.NODE_1746_length_898_cov_279.548881_g1218_i0~~NODE_1746_length_898_cov_279.548881_g1218_i0.p1  ORF type:complete len:218 (-),score=70.50 NODE_1746_length_898_cov_279.548881_g1218_i0:156-809(-)